MVLTSLRGVTTNQLLDYQPLKDCFTTFVMTCLSIFGHPHLNLFIMKNIFVLFVLFASNVWGQTGVFLDKSKEYHYRAIYIDKSGDTITNEKLIIKPLCRPWFWQPKLQTAIRYFYYPDPIQYKNYVDPDSFFHAKDLRYYQRKGKIRANKKETTGGVITDHEFYMHPPRVNQYRMLFYAPHPWIHHGCYFDSLYPYSLERKIYGMGVFQQIYNASVLPDTVINNELVKIWAVSVASTGDIKQRFLAKKIFNSTLDALFTREFGFIKMYYTFENGIKIQFDLEKVVEL